MAKPAGLRESASALGGLAARGSQEFDFIREVTWDVLFGDEEK